MSTNVVDLHGGDRAFRDDARGTGRTADDAAWAMIANAAAVALTVPGLSAQTESDMTRLHEASLRCTRLPVA